MIQWDDFEQDCPEDWRALRRQERKHRARARRVVAKADRIDRRHALGRLGQLMSGGRSYGAHG